MSKPNYYLILNTFYQGKQWAVSEDDTYENIRWLDETPKPTKKELDALATEALNIQNEKNIKEKRAEEMPSLGDAADIQYKERQKRKLLVGQARAAKAAGDTNKALDLLLEAVEPIQESLAYDAQVAAVKAKYPKEKEGK